MLPRASRTAVRFRPAKPKVKREHPVVQGQRQAEQRRPEKRREDAGFQLRPEGAEEAGEEIALLAAQAVNRAVVQRGGGRAERHKRDTADAPQQTQHHDLAQKAEGLPQKTLGVEQFTSHQPINSGTSVLSLSAS